MPVTVEAVGTPSPQDLIDLQKIYADAPDWLLHPYPDAQALLEAALADGSLIAGRFNDRLLGAARLQPGTPGWHLAHLCVRRVTRGRGVGRRLLDVARERAGAADAPLHLLAPAEQLEARAFAARNHLPLDTLPTA